MSGPTRPARFRRRPENDQPTPTEQAERAEAAVAVQAPGRLGAAMALTVPPRAEDGSLQQVFPVQLEDEVYALRLAGHTPAEIALTMGKRGVVLTETEVARIVTNVGERRGLVLGQSLRDELVLDYQRIERMIQALWSEACKGNPNAIDRVERLLRRKAEMLGLDSSKVQLHIHADPTKTYDKLSIDELRTLKALLAKAGQSDPTIKDVQGRVK